MNMMTTGVYEYQNGPLSGATIPIGHGRPAHFRSGDGTIIRPEKASRLIRSRQGVYVLRPTEVEIKPWVFIRHFVYEWQESGPDHG